MVGEGARAIRDGANHEGSWGDEVVLADDLAVATAFLESELRPGDVVLVKSSYGAGLWRLGDTPGRGGRPMRAVLISGGLAMLIALLGTPLFIRFLVHKQYGQFIRQDGPTAHFTKRGTPDHGRRRHHRRDAARAGSAA